MKYFFVMFALVLAGCTTGSATNEGDEKTYERVKFVGEKATSEERAKCESVGGTVRRAGMAGWEHCIQNMPDAGKVCSDSSDCTARCEIPPQEGREYSPGEAATGQCAPTDEIFGCFTRVENGKADATLCVD